MRRRTWLWLGVGFALVVATPWAVISYRSRLEAAEYREQLRLARAEGLPTTAEEYIAYVPTAKPEENAAPIYRKLRALTVGSEEVSKLDASLTFHPTMQDEAAARATLERLKPWLGLADQATRLPRCWFDREWRGSATLFPEYARMKDAARLLGLRGTLAAAHGDSLAALQDARRILMIAKHAGEEPHAIARLVRESIYLIGLRHLAGWAYSHRGAPAYRSALEQAVEEFPKPNLNDEDRAALYEVLSVIELCSTQEGQAELGLKPDDISKAENLFGILLSRSKSRINIVKAARAAWAALDRPSKERAVLLTAARQDLYQALLAFPTAARVYEMLTSGGDVDWRATREEMWTAQQQQYIALSRALGGPKTPKAIRTDDLLSPFDGKPLTYRLEDGQIVIQVSGYEGSRLLLKMPSDNALGKSASSLTR